MGGGGSKSDDEQEKTSNNKDNSEVENEKDQEEIAATTQPRDEEEIKWQREVFYKLYADWRFEFENDQTIRVNSAILASKSKKFHQLFKRPRDYRYRRVTPRIVRIQDQDIATFKLFLDCLLGFQDYSVLDVLLIFPIAHKYETKLFVKECINFLTPVFLNENLCYVLNLGLICECGELVQVVMDFLTKKKLFYKLLDDEELCKILEPESMSKLLENVKMDSYLLQNVLKWGKHNLKKKLNSSGDLKSLFKKFKIMDKLNLSCFESASSALEFRGSELGANFFQDEEFFRNFDRFKPGRSEWVKIKKGDKITEKIVVKDVFNVKKHDLEILIFSNSAVYYDHPKKDSETMALVFVTYSYDGRKKSSKNEDIFDVTMKMIYSRVLNEGLAVKIDDLTNEVKDVEFEIVYNFLFDCRVLKTTPPENFSPKKDKDELFFTNSVKVVRKEK